MLYTFPFEIRVILIMSEVVQLFKKGSHEESMDILASLKSLIEDYESGQRIIPDNVMLLEYRIIPAEDKESNSSMVFGKPISCNSLIGLLEFFKLNLIASSCEKGD